ncbi:MAG: zinc-binding dehydrogenase [Ignavibacteria bacterium]|nr:zinc-binding dehydrogenase [Ignavibacteria bacterium]
MIRQVYRIDRPGSIRKLKFVSEPLDAPLKNEVTVEVKAIGLNFADIFTILGFYKAAPKRNFIPGLEFSGVIIQKGSAVNDFQIGDSVMGVIKFGSYATHLNIDQRYTLKLPDEWTFDEGASFIVNALTAFYALTKLGNLHSGGTVLIESAAGGVGIYANRIAKKFSAFTIGIVGREEKVKFAKSEGYDEVLLRDKNLKNNIRTALKDRTLDLVLEAVGGKGLTDKFNLLAPTGRMIIYGSASFSTGKFGSNYLKLIYNYMKRPKIDTLNIIEQNRTVSGFNLIWIYDRVDMLKGMLPEILELNLPKPIINERFPFEQLPNAVARLKSGETIGKVVLTV